MTWFRQNKKIKILLPHEMILSELFPLTLTEDKILEDKNCFSSFENFI